MTRTERREAILEGATRAFSVAGYRATSMADVAREVGVTELILYRHFDTKDALYRAALERVPDVLGEEPDGGANDGVAISVRSVLAAARLDPDAFQLLWRHAAREPLFQPYVDSRRKRVLETATALVAGQADEDDLTFAANTLVSYLIDSVLNWLEFGDPERDDMFVEATDAAMREGLRVWKKLLARESSSRSATG